GCNAQGSGHGLALPNRPPSVNSEDFSWGAGQVLSNERGTIPQPGGLAEISRGLSEATPPVLGHPSPHPGRGARTSSGPAATLPGSRGLGTDSGGILAARLNPGLISGIAPRCSASGLSWTVVQNLTCAPFLGAPARSTRKEKPRPLSNGS